MSLPENCICGRAQYEEYGRHKPWCSYRVQYDNAHRADNAVDVREDERLPDQYIEVSYGWANDGHGVMRKWSLNGVSYRDAPKPGRFHRHKVWERLQTSRFIRDHCACGYQRWYWFDSIWRPKWGPPWFSWDDETS